MIVALPGLFSYLCFLSEILKTLGRHLCFYFLSSLPVSVKRILYLAANKFYDMGQQLYDAALLARCYSQHALRPFIDTEAIHKRHFVKTPFINFINLPSIFAGLGGSVGCAVRLETRRSRVQPPSRSATFFRGD